MTAALGARLNVEVSLARSNCTVVWADSPDALVYGPRVIENSRVWSAAILKVVPVPEDVSCVSALLLPSSGNRLAGKRRRGDSGVCDSDESAEQEYESHVHFTYEAQHLS